MIIYDPILTGSLNVNGTPLSSIESIDTVSGSVVDLTLASGSFSDRVSSNEASINSLNSASSSYLLNTTDTLDGDLTVTGKITAQEFHTEFVSASIIYESGSTQFGNSSDDTHIFSGSVSVSNGILGTLSTAAQPNVTSLGTLSGLAVSSTSTIISTFTSDNAASALSIDNTNANDWGSNIGFYSNATAAGFVGTIGSLIGNTDKDITLYAQSGNGVRFYTNGNNERMRITSSGNVGIGTSSPTEKLTVNGNINFPFSTSGTAYFGIEPSPTNPFATSAKELIIRGANAYTAGTPTQAQAGGNVYIKGGYGIVNTGLGAYAGDVHIQGGEAHTGSSTGAGNVIVSTAGLERMRITSEGTVLINSTSRVAGRMGTDGRLEVAGELYSKGSLCGYFWEDRSNSTNWYGIYTTGNTIYFYNGGGSANLASINTSSGAYTALSDKNKKKDFEGSNIGLNEVLQLKPTLYRMLTDHSSTEKELGFIAQDVKDVIPQAYIEEISVDASNTESTFIGLKDRPILAAAVKAIQEQQAIIEDLKSRLEALEG